MAATTAETATVRIDQDQELKLLAKRDLRAAFDGLVSKYRPRLYRHALCIVKDQQEAWDAVQDVFIKAMRENRLFQADFQIKAWLFRVTSNLCYNIVRDKRRRRDLLSLREEEVRPKGIQRGTGEGVEQNQAHAAMMEAMGQLTENHRDILMLRYYDDLSYNEIASRLEVKLGTVMSRLSRARGNLGKILGPSHPLVLEFA